MDGNSQEFTPRQRAYLEHVRQAKEEGLALTDYCQKLGLNVRSLYGVRREMVRKGLLPRTLASRTKAKVQRSPFVSVRVAPPAPSGGDTVCRVRHPSGVVIECGHWPDAAWVLELTKDAGHASA